MIKGLLIFGEDMMQRRMIITAFLIGLLVGMVGAQGDASDSCNQLDWEFKDGGCVLEETVSMSGRAAYPQELAEKSPFAKAIMLEYIRQEQYNFWKLMQDAVVMPQATFHENFPNSYEIRYELFLHSENIESVVFLSLSFPGGGRGNPTYQSFTFDLLTNRVLSLSDIFLEDIDPYIVIAPHARDALGKEKMVNKDRIASATVPSADNYSVWALTDSSLLIYFYGPDLTGAMAVVSVVAEIPFADLKDVLRPEFLPRP